MATHATRPQAPSDMAGPFWLKVVTQHRAWACGSLQNCESAAALLLSGSTCASGTQWTCVSICRHVT